MKKFILAGLLLMIGAVYGQSLKIVRGNRLFDHNKEQVVEIKHVERGSHLHGIETDRLR